MYAHRVTSTIKERQRERERHKARKEGGRDLEVMQASLRLRKLMGKESIHSRRSLNSKLQLPNLRLLLLRHGALLRRPQLRRSGVSAAALVPALQERRGLWHAFSHDA